MRLLVLALAGLTLLSCRDLTVQSAGATKNPGPTARVLLPANGAVVPLAPFVRVEAEDANGVQSVTLSCPAGVLRTWTAAPYEGQVDLSPCLPFESPDGGALLPVVLSALAVDSLGNRGEVASAALDVDRRQPVLRVDLPARVQPLGALHFSLSSDTPLAAPPTVTIDGQTAAAKATDSSSQYFDVLFAPAPGLGVDGVPDGGELSLDELEKIERQLPVEVSATSQMGNSTRLVLSTLLSRIAWERGVPGGLAVDPGDSFSPGTMPLSPQAGPEGLVVPQPQAVFFDGGFLPGYLGYLNGSYGGADPALLADAGTLLPRALEPWGGTLFAINAGAATETNFRMPFGGQALQPVAPGFSASSAFKLGAFRLWPTERALCQLHVASAGNNCTLNVECLDSSDTGVVGKASDFATGQGSFLDTTGPVLRSGSSVLGLGPSFVGTSSCWTAGAGPTASLLLGSMADALPLDRLAPTEVVSVQRAVSAGDGTFVVRLGMAATSQRTVRVALLTLAPRGQLTDYFTGSRSGVGLVWDEAVELLAALPGGKALSVSQPAPGTHTALELRDTNQPNPVAAAKLPGVWTYVRGPDAQLAQNVVVDPNLGRLYVLMRTGTDASAVYHVVAMDFDLRVRWTYRYPFTQNPHLDTPLSLVGNDSSDQLYLIDPDGQRVVALWR